MKKYLLIFVVLLLQLTAPLPVFAAGTRDLLYQLGLVFDADGNPINGTFDVAFRLYNSSSAEDPLWEETQEIFFDNGVYTAPLGNSVELPDDLFDEGSLYLGVEIDGDGEMTPRLPLFAVPFAKQAEVAEVAYALADDIVTTGNIANGAVGSSDIAVGGVESSNIASGAIGAAELASSGVTAGTYTLATVTVDADGRITSASSGSAGGGGSGDITGVSPGTGLSGGGLSGDVTLSVAAGGISATEILDGTITALDLSGSAGITDAQVSDILTASNLVAASAVVSDAEVDDNLTINGGTIENSVIGGTTPNAGTFTTMTVDGTTSAGLVMMAFGAGAGETAEIRFRELDAGGTEYVGFKAPDAISSSLIWTLPDTDGSSGDVLSTDGAGGLSWAAVAASGDITGVTAGSGLTGGGLSGGVTLDVGAGTGLSVAADSIGIAAGGVTTTEIALDTILAVDISADAVGASEIAADAVGSSEIATDAVGASEIAADAVGSSEIAADAVGVSEIITDGVGSAEIAADAVGSSEIATDAVGAAEIASDAVGSSEIAADAVGSSEIAADAVGSSELASTAVTAGSYTVASITVDADGRLTAASSGSETGDISAVGNATTGSAFVDGTSNGTELVYEGATVDLFENRLAFTGDPIADSIVTIPNTTGTIVTTGDTDTVTSAMIAADAVGASEIAADAVGSSEIATDAVGAAEISADAVGSSEIAADAVGSSEIATDGVGSAEIVANAVGASEISDNSVDATELAATLTMADGDFLNLSAILHNDTAVQGLRLPNVGATPVDPTGTGEGYVAWDEAGDRLLVNDGSAWNSIGNPFGTSIDSSEITDDTITTSDIATDGVGSAEIAADAVGSSEIATDAVGAAEIAADAVGSSELASTAVTAGSYTVASITVDADGRLTAASSGSETGDISAVGNATTGAAFVDGTNNGTELVYEGATVDLFENRLAFTGDPAADTTVTIPNTTGTLVTTGDTGSVSGTMITDSTVSAADLAAAVAGSGLTGGAGSALAVGAGNGITVNADDIAVDATTTSTTSTTSSNSGLEVTSAGVRMLGGCSNGQLLKWNSGTSVWECSSDSGGAGSDLQSASTYDTTEALTNVASAEVEIAQVDITPSTATGDVYVRAQFDIVSSNNTDQSLVVNIENNATCTGTVLETVTLTITSGTGTAVGTYELADVVVDAGASAQSYTLCMSTATGDTDIRFSEMHATVIDTGADYAELYTTNDPTLSAGNVVSFDSTLKAGMKKSRQAYDTNVLGIVATKPGYVIGAVEKEGVDVLPVALSGRVPVRATTHNGRNPIGVGDYLTTSDIPGLAMRADRSGDVIGRAMTPLESGDGTILVFVEPGYRAGPGMEEKIEAGSVVSDATGYAEVAFEHSVGRIEPVVNLTVKGEKLTFAQVSEFIRDGESNVTGFVIKTFDPNGSEAPKALVDYMVVPQ